MTDTTTLRALMQAEIDAELAYKKAKAERFLEHRDDGDGITDIWQSIAADPQIAGLERAHLEAKADRMVAYLELTGNAADDDGS